MTTETRKRVITPERFGQGYTWADYLAAIQTNKDRFQRFYDDFQPEPAEVDFFERFILRKGPVRVAAIGEDWCPDVVRGIPCIARLAQAAGMELRIFPRDRNLDLMDEYLWRHEFQSIPVFVFLGRDWNELGHFIERPATAYKFVAEVRQELAPRNLSDEETMKIVRERREPVQLAWMHDTVREIREQVFYRVL